jgi:beta-mannosidase
VVAARLVRADTGEVVADDFRFPAGMDLRPQREVDIAARTRRQGDGSIMVTLRTDRFLQSVNVSCEGFVPSDNYFHLAPGQEKAVVFTGSSSGFTAVFEALNWTDRCRAQL